MADPAPNPFRALPSVDEVLADPGVDAALGGLPRGRAREVVGEVLDDLRAEIRGGLGADEVAEAVREGLAGRVAARVARLRRRGVRRVLNATGVVLHTGLGRAPVHPDVAAAMAEAARSYCTVEVDPGTGRRNRRDDRVSELLGRLTGAEAALAVNNCAAAVLLTLSTFAAGRRTVVSRGELVEIGGSFRMPRIMARAGTRLVEVGTTNRTRIDDYRAAVGPRTGLLLKVHRSNFHQEGFTEEVSPEALAALGRELGVPTAFDLGSGLLDAEGPLLDLLPSEPRVLAAVAAGLDVVAFSGDKLLGGPQAGFLVGTRTAVTELRANPLYRALRLDKVALAGIEATLDLYVAGRQDELPTRRLLLRSEQAVERDAAALASELAALGYEARVVREASQPGSGSAPDAVLTTSAVEVTRGGTSAEALAARLRRGDPPVFARVQRDAVLVDPRTLLDGEAAELVKAFRAAAE